MTDEQREVAAHGAPADIFYPIWGRGVISSRPDRATADLTKAGHNDRVLIAGPNPDSNLAICEDKTFWSYKNSDYHHVLDHVGSTGNLGGAVFNWDGDVIATTMVKQVCRTSPCHTESM